MVGEESVEGCETVVIDCFPVYGVVGCDAVLDEFIDVFIPLLLLLVVGFMMLLGCWRLTPPKSNQWSYVCEVN